MNFEFWIGHKLQACASGGKLTKEFNIKDLEKIKKYLSNGVQFSPRVEKLIKVNNISL